VALLVAVLALGACAAGSAEPPIRATGPLFPRTATYWLSQDYLPSVDELARYDLVVMDSEWANRVDHQIFAELRQRKQAIVLLAYVNLIDYPPRLGSPGYYADRYALWQYQDSTTSTFPPQWLARTAAGQSVSQWPNSVMANFADTAPSVGGQRYAEYAANWVVDRVWSTGLWDGIFLDVWGDRVYGADRTSWDVDGNGIDDPDSTIYGPGGPWERGVTRAEEIMRKRMPTAILIGNGDRTMRKQLLDGRAFESFADPGADRDPIVEITHYVRLARDIQHRTPGTTMTINRRRTAPGSENDYRNARFFLTGTLLQDGFWAPMGLDYGELTYYDEMDGAGLGRGYLGRPMTSDPAPDQVAAPYVVGIGTIAPGVVRRDFEHGIVLNNAGTEPATVDLRRNFRKLRGTQDPGTNDGSTVTSVTIPGRDGLILLSAAG
jgi:hypothetical protein